PRVPAAARSAVSLGCRRCGPERTCRPEERQAPYGACPITLLPAGAYVNCQILPATRKWPRASPAQQIWGAHEVTRAVFAPLMSRGGSTGAAAAQELALLLDEVHQDVVAQGLGGGEERPAPVHLRQLLD